MNKRKLLYIACANEESFSGGTQCMKRNLESLKDILGEDHIDTYIIKPDFRKRNIRRKIERTWDLLHFYAGGMTCKDKQHITDILYKNKYDSVYIDSSSLGILAKVVKHLFHNINVYVFFQNVEYDYMVSTTLHSGDYKHIFWIATAKYNESLACKYADKIITLNDADRRRVLQLYGRDSISIPVTMKDDYHDLKSTEIKSTDNPPKALFVGSYFAGNIKGIKWFCNEVLPKANIELCIIGSGMEQLKEEVKPSPKLTIKGRTPNLTPYYEQADFVVLPIISGGGMKVKTAEALKYGKYIIGTREALEGYCLGKNTALECNNEEEFINAINSFKLPNKYNNISRQIFKTKFSYSKSLELFKRCLKIDEN